MAKKPAAQQQPPRRAATPPVRPAPTVPPVPAAGAAGTALAASLAATFAAGLTGVALVAACKKILVAAGVSAVIIGFLVLYAFTSVPAHESPFPAGPAEEEQIRLGAAYRAWYIVNAVRRLERAEAKGPEAFVKAREREAQFFQWHLRAMHNRVNSAAAVDDAAGRYGLLLGWRAVMDVRTTLECRAANGKNFRADKEPVIGWPGSVHPHCRCVPVGPFPGAPVIPAL